MAGLFAVVFLAAVIGIFKPYIKGTKRWHFALGAVISFFMVGVFAEPSTTKGGEAEQVADATEGSEASDAATPEEVEAKPASAWEYHTQKDEMRGAESRFAQLSGSNTIDLDFPYGEQRGRLVIRQSAQHGFDIIVGVDSGQIMCNSFTNSHINVKFDDGPIQRYRCFDASDGTNNMVFIDGAKGFLAKLKKSKKIIVEAEFFQNGTQQLTFDTANLEWDN